MFSVYQTEPHHYKFNTSATCCYLCVWITIFWAHICMGHVTVEVLYMY